MTTPAPRRAQVPRQRPRGGGSWDLRRRVRLERIRAALERHRARQPEMYDPARHGGTRDDLLDLHHLLHRDVDAFVAALTDRQHTWTGDSHP